MEYNDLTYCTSANIKKITAIVQTVSEEYIEPFIMSAEEMHIIPILGTALDTELKSELSQGILSGANETLVTNYIIPASAWYSFYDAVPFLSVKVFNKGLVKQFSDNSNPIDRDELKDYRQAVKDKATFYINNLRKFLIDNSSTYPLYRSDDNCDGGGGRHWSSGIYLGN